MKSHPVEEFLRNQTSLLMQKHLFITKRDSLAILAKFNRREMKILADNIPLLEKYIDYLVWDFGSKSEFSIDDPLNRIDIKKIKEFTPSGPGTLHENPIVFSNEFKELIAQNPSMLFVDKLSLMLSTKDILRKSFLIYDNNKLFNNLKPSTLPEFYLYITNAPRKIAQAFREHELSREEEISPLCHNIFDRLNNDYPHISLEVKNKLFPVNTIIDYFTSDRALDKTLFVDDITRQDILSKWVPHKIKLLPEVAEILKSKVLTEIQGPFGRNRLELINLVFAEGSIYQTYDKGSAMAIAMQYSDNRRLIPKMISEKFLLCVTHLPQIVGRDEHGHMLDLDDYNENQNRIELAYDLLASGDTNLTNLNYSFHALPIFSNSENEHLYNRNIVGAILLICLLTSGYFAGSSLWNFYRSVDRRVRAVFDNNSLLNFLDSLPAPDVIPEFLTEEELKKFEEYNNELNDDEIKEYNKKNLDLYKEFMLKECIFTLDDADKIKDPLMIDGIYFEPSNNIDDQAERIIKRRWEFIYTFSSFKEYAAKKLTNVATTIPQTKDRILLQPEEDQLMYFYRGFPEYVKNFITTVKQANDTQLNPAAQKPKTDTVFFKTNNKELDVKIETPVEKKIENKKKS